MGGMGTLGGRPAIQKDERQRREIITNEASPTQTGKPRLTGGASTLLSQEGLNGLQAVWDAADARVLIPPQQQQETLILLHAEVEPRRRTVRTLTREEWRNFHQYDLLIAQRLGAKLQALGLAVRESVVFYLTPELEPEVERVILADAMMCPTNGFLMKVFVEPFDRSGIETAQMTSSGLDKQLRLDDIEALISHLKSIQSFC